MVLGVHAYTKSHSCADAFLCKGVNRTPCECHHCILMKSVPPFTQNGRMRIISAFPFGPTGRYSALRIQRYGCPWVRPRAGPESRLVACANAPGLVWRLPCGLCSPARSHAHYHAHAHVHFTCAYAARVVIAHVHVGLAWPPRQLCDAPPFKLSVRAPRRPCAGECGIRPGPCAGCCSRCGPAYATIVS